MANLNVKRLTAAEARRIRTAARGRSETMRDFVLRAGRLRADILRAVEALMEAGEPIPKCPMVAATEAGRLPVDKDFEDHAASCPMCFAERVQYHVGRSLALGWADLAKELGGGFDGLQARVAALPERERDLLTDLYGLDGRRRQTMAEVGRTLGLSRERVRQLAGRAKAALRAAAPGSPRPRARRG